ncbi:MAG: DEAD/DEAH box helicase family protein, partial [Gemmatimonadales bacterium]
MQLLFDRGTILLEDPPEGDLRNVPGVLWDPRVRAHRAPAFLYPRLKHELARRGLCFTDRVCVRAPGPEAWSPPELRPYQDAALAAWELAGRRGILALPTGSGKTIVAIAAMSRSGARTLCLVPTRVLLAQWHRELARFYP